MDMKIYDLGDSYEVIGYTPTDMTPLNAEQKEKSDLWKDNNFDEIEKEFISKQNNERAERRARSKIRRVCKKYKLKYMWTLTIASQKVREVNSTNAIESVYDAGDMKDAWKLWERFIDRCRRNGYKFNYIVTIELQEKRLAERGERVYHFHFATDSFLAINEEYAKKFNKKQHLEMYWTYGFAKVSRKRSKQAHRMANDYLMKYIGKTFDETTKGKQRYRIANFLIIHNETLHSVNFDDLFNWCKANGRLLVFKNVNIEGSDYPIQWGLVQKKSKRNEEIL